LFFARDGGVGHVTAGIDQGDELGGISFDGFTSALFAVFHDGIEVLEESDLAADLFEFGGRGGTTFTDDVSGGLGLNEGAVVNELGFEVILVTTEAPVAEVIFGEVPAGGSEFFDDLFVGEAVVEHAVDLKAQICGQASDFAVAPGLGQAGLELLVEVVFGGVGDEGGGHGFLNFAF
jgi:hypothetical protein